MYNFIYSSSDEYAPYCLTSIYSLLQNNRDITESHFFILSNNIRPATKDRMRQVCGQFGAEVEFIDCDPVIRKLFAQGGKLNFNPSSFLRIFIPELLPKTVDKALFIDSDTYINSGISTLYNTDISEYYCAMVYNQPIYKEMLAEASLKPDDGYFNAGVILLNLAAWRTNDIQNSILDYYYSNGANFPTDDQSVINAIVGIKTMALPYQYNAMIGIFFWSYRKFCNLNIPIGERSPEEFYHAKKHPVIVHFNGPGIRPWEKWCAHPYTKLYRKTLRQCMPGYKLQSTKKSLIFQMMQYFKHIIIDKLEQVIFK